MSLDRLQTRWDSKRQIRFTFEELDGLAEEIADRDFEGQLRATLQNESLPQTVQHLQPPGDRFASPYTAAPHGLTLE